MNNYTSLYLDILMKITLDYTKYDATKIFTLCVVYQLFQLPHLVLNLFRSKEVKIGVVTPSGFK